MRSGSSMFSAAVRVGRRLKDWNTNPIAERRSRVSCLSLSRVMSVSPISTLPESTVSSPARQCRSVDLPEPDGPMIALKRPAVNDAETPPRAVTAASPLP